MSGTSQSASEADTAGKLELAKVIEVNILEYSVDVQTVFTHKDLTDIPFGALYAHQDHGGGVYVMPEVGAHCYVGSSGDGTKFIVGWVVNPETRVNPVLNEDGTIDTSLGDQGPNFAGRRPMLEPGDILLATRDGNMVSIKRGGIIQIASTGLCQRLYIPIENLIRDIFQRKESKSPLGEVIWGHAALADGGNEETGVLIEGSWKEFAQDSDFALEVRLGRLDETLLDPEVDVEHNFRNGQEAEGVGISATEVGVLSLAVFGRDDQAVVYKMQLSREGDLFILAKGHIHVEATKRVFFKLEEGARVEFGTSVVELLSESDTLRAVVKQLVLDQLVSLTVVAVGMDLTVGGTKIAAGLGGMTVEGPVNIGAAGGVPVIVDRGKLLELVKDHKHPFDIPDQGRFTTLASDTLSGIEAAVAQSLKAS